MNQIIDPFNRRITYLRVSVTDHCNYRCHYCRDEDHQTHTKKSQVLTFEEIAKIVRLFAELGVTKVRLTGGEPLLRKDILDLTKMLGEIPGLTDIPLSTNAHLLPGLASKLKNNGINRANISIDSLDPVRFKEITRDGDLVRVIKGIDAAISVGIKPIKLNMVVMKGINDDEQSGIEIVVAALQYPLRQIADNAGVEGAVVVGNVIAENKANYGYDAQNDQYGDMVKKGIIDPVKVVRTALMDAASVASLILTTEVAIVEAPKPESAAPAMPDMGGMGGMGGMM